MIDENAKSKDPYVAPFFLCGTDDGKAPKGESC